MSKSTRLEIVLKHSGSRQILEIAESRLDVPLTSLLADADLPLNMRCGGRGLCNGCQILLQEGTLRHIATQQTVSASEQTISACQHCVCPGENATLLIPDTSHLWHSAQIADEFKTKVSVARDPLFTPPAVGASIDIGTTTVAVLLADMEDGLILANATAMNRQISVGDNVITRINHCMTDKKKITELQQLIVNDTILPLLEEACAEAAISLSQIAGIVVSGNATMLHLLAGIDPSSMGVAPFTPVFLDHRVLHATDLGLAKTLSATAQIHLLPSLAAYVGADINAGIFATGMHYEEGPNLLVDIGTNGEIALKFRDRLFGCATAAGPAFEGAGLTCGIQAVAGAISKISFSDEPFAVQLEQIHGNNPKRCPGICGSGYIDFLGQGVRHNLLTATGRFSNEFAANHPDLVQTIDDERIFVLFPKTQSQEHLVGISELDISRLLQAKAAIAAGIGTLLAQVGLQPGDIRKLYLAGGFGLHLDVSNAISCGLLPGFTEQQIEVVGNTSLAGAYLALQDRGVLEELRHNQGRVEVVELNLDPAFEDRYIENLMLDVG